MNPLSSANKIYLADSSISKAGRGVFALVDIKKDEVIESAPALVLPKDDYPLLKQTLLLNYYFMWSEQNDQVAIALGFGSLYNHSYEPNATYKKDIENSIINFIAIKDIKKCEEITVNYNYGNPEDQKPLWIKDIPRAEAER